MQPVSDSLKAEVQAKANELVENVIKPEHVKPPPKDNEWNYIVDIYTKWHGSFFTFALSITHQDLTPYLHLSRKNLLVWDTLAINVLIFRT